MKTIVGNLYNPYDNSHCININTNEVSYLVPWGGSNEYNPNKIEIGATFVIVSEPYEETVVNVCKDYVTKTFVNVKSSVTDEVYRTLYWEDRVIFLDKQKIENLIEQYNKIVPSLEDEILNYLHRVVNKFEDKYIDMTYIEDYEREMVVDDETVRYKSISIEKAETPSQIDTILISLIDGYNNEYDENVSYLSVEQLIELYNRVSEHIQNNGYNNIVNEE